MNPVLNRIPEFDERSRNFPIRTLLATAPRQNRSYTWRCLDTLDQKSEGACVGFAWTHELAARPAEVTGLSAITARAIYKDAQTKDPWEGTDYSGTSVLAGVKATKALHPDKIDSYKWAFGLADVLQTLSWHGPVVLGINWYEGQFVPVNGVISPTGQLAGGHAILANGIDLKRKLVRLHNSWGRSWGLNGACFISFSDLDRLLHEQGEACVAVGRTPEKRRKVSL